MKPLEGSDTEWPLWALRKEERWIRRTDENSPNGWADVVVKVILDKATHDARFPNTGVLEEEENTAVKIKAADSDRV